MEIVSIVISVLALFFSAITFVFTWVIERKRITIAAYNELQASLYEFYRYEDTEVQDFVTDNTNNEYKYLSTCLANIEVYATGVKTKAYSFSITYAVAHGFLDGSLRDKIEHMLEMKNVHQKGQYYKNTRWLLKKMDKKSKKHF